MLVKTKYFGEIDLSEDKIITMENGLMGFEEYKQYTILYNNEGEGQPNISWLQSVEEPALALPVINPFLVKSDYNPVVEDEVLKSLGELNEENLAIFLVLTVPAKPEEVTANLKAPVIINADTRKGCQIIVENKDYVIKYKVYEAIQKIKKEKGEMEC
ncbi:MAG: flagellar assembly protein FliW [Clostridiales bacterium]|nr:flagellar assembly protein FliW [Clostridiales bacterium]